MIILFFVFARAERWRGEAVGRADDRQPGCLFVTVPGWAEDGASRDAMHGAVPGMEAYARNWRGNTHIFVHTRRTHTHQHTQALHCTEAWSKHLQAHTRTSADNHTCTQGFHWTPSYNQNSCTNTRTLTRTHNLCKWGPEVPWHVADAQFSCPHPVSRPNQSSPPHTGQQHGRRWKTILMKEVFLMFIISVFPICSLVYSWCLVIHMHLSIHVSVSLLKQDFNRLNTFLVFSL